MRYATLGVIVFVMAWLGMTLANSQGDSLTCQGDNTFYTVPVGSSDHPQTMITCEQPTITLGFSEE